MISAPIAGGQTLVPVADRPNPGRALSPEGGIGGSLMARAPYPAARPQGRVPQRSASPMARPSAETAQPPGRGTPIWRDSIPARRFSNGSQQVPLLLETPAARAPYAPGGQLRQAIAIGRHNPLVAGIVAAWSVVTLVALCMAGAALTKVVVLSERLKGLERRA